MQKRKSIIIQQENVSPIYLEDEDDRTLEDYSDALSSFMTLTNISILHTSTGSLIIRPSKICSIAVHEENVYKDTAELQMAKDVTPEAIEEPKQKEKQVDIITDVD